MLGIACIEAQSLRKDKILDTKEYKRRVLSFGGF
jgi:hypothetical protein